MNPLRKLASQTAIYGLSSIVGRLLNYFLVPLYTRIFTPAEYGVVTELYAYVSLLLILFTYGMETAFFRFYELEENKRKVFSTVLKGIVASSILLSGTLIFFYKDLSILLDYQGNSEYILWFAFILGADAISSIPFAKLRSEQRAARFAWVRFANILINIGLNVFFLVLCPYLILNGTEGVQNFIHFIYREEIGIGYIFISNLIASLFTLLLLLPELRGITERSDFRLWKKMFVFAAPLIIAGMAGMINETFDRILLKILIPDTQQAMIQIGIYGACYKLSILMTLFIQMFRYAAEPFFFSQIKNENAKEVYADVMKYFVIICSFIFLLIMLFIDLFKNFIGADFHEGLKIVPILLLANMSLGIFFNLSIWYKLSGQTKYGAWLAVFGAVITIALNLLLIPLFGYLGAAWTTLFCYGLMMIASYIIGQRNYPVPYDLKRILFFIGLAFFFYILSENLLLPSKGFQYVLSTILLLLFVATAWFLEGRHLRRRI